MSTSKIQLTVEHSQSHKATKELNNGSGARLGNKNKIQQKANGQTKQVQLIVQEIQQMMIDNVQPSNKQQKKKKKKKQQDVVQGQQQNNEQKLTKKDKKSIKKTNKQLIEQQQQLNEFIGNGNIKQHNPSNSNKQQQSSSLPIKTTDKQLQTIENINKQSNRTKLTIQQLVQLYKQQSYKVFLKNGHNPQKQHQIQTHLTKLQSEKQRRHQKLQKLKKQQEQRLKQKQQHVKKRQETKKQRDRKKRRQSIQKRLKSLDLKAHQRQEEYAKFSEYCMDRKRNFVPRYAKYEQRQKQIDQQAKRQYDLVVKKHKQKYGPMNREDILKHEETYAQQRDEAYEHGERKLMLQKQMIKQQNEWMKKLYKGQARKKLQKEIKASGSISGSAYHQSLSAAKEKLAKTKQYGELVKSQFVVESRLDTENSDETQSKSRQSRLKDSHNFRMRQKFEHGKCLGLVPEKIIHAKTIEQKSKLGVQYLQHIRKLPRKNIKSSSESQSQSQSQNQDFKLADQNNNQNNPSLSPLKPVSPSKSVRNGKTYIMKRKSNPYYSVERSSKSSSFDKSNYNDIELRLKHLRSKDQRTAFEERSLSHYKYSDITEMQKRHVNVNKRMINDISEKLDILRQLN